GIAFEDRVERLARLPVLAPARAAAEHAGLQPDVVQIQLPEKELRVIVEGAARDARARQRLPARELRKKGVGELAARGAAFDGGLAIFGLADEAFHLKEQRGRAQFDRGEILELGSANA